MAYAGASGVRNSPTIHGLNSHVNPNTASPQTNAVPSAIANASLPRRISPAP